MYVTSGIAEEVERHLNLAFAFSRTETSKWRSTVPFIYSAFALSGQARSDFYKWAETFRGSEEPVADILEYLEEDHGIEHRDLTAEVAEADGTLLKSAIQEIWLEAHERRRRPGTEYDLDSATKLKLANHDVETTLGVIQRRARSALFPVGYHAWLLTLDSVAFRLSDKLTEWLGADAPKSPVMSPDFMSQYLRLGPLRTALERELWANLPIITDVSRFDFMPKSLITEADKLRSELSEVSDKVASRRIRDTLNRMKRSIGPEAVGGARLMEERVIDAIRKHPFRAGDNASSG
ncbi:hypothetical protein [Actinoplanes sp. ATCC 53533]|uniref:hypothetical protein n=1 Tax=Actinoplanes sp. ATCC 53533 TaxID=1288362 RepID=UPI000F78142C|nr:hypothetical protein [Actinoplanes sp. ATCC 53533]